MTRRPAAVAAGLSAAVLAGSYFWLSLEHGTLALWNVAVHESGRYTLAETIFYFRHFLREIPVDIALAFFIAAAAAAILPTRGSAPRARRFATAGAILALTLLGIALIVSVGQQGGAATFRDLFQYRTRDDVESYGSHWHYHWLQLMWFACAATLLVRLTGTRLSWRDNAARPLLVAWLLAAAGTAVFLLDAQVFLSVRYAAHQAREMFTHALVTGPFTWFVLSVAAGEAADRANLLVSSARASAGRAAGREMLPSLLGLGLVLVLIPLWLTAVVLLGDLAAEAQTGGGAAGLVAGHFFEHVLDYAFVAGVALFAFGLFTRRPRNGETT